jgi:serine/threonine protein kinase
LELIHSKNLVHRDIKPDHFLIGINDPYVIYIIDFGLCKKYRSSKTGKHILPKVNKNFFGNLKFSSSNVIKGKESSRRDDIISLGYMLIYFIKKGLPWDYTYKTKITSSKLFELAYLKDTNACGNLFNGLPSEFKEFIKYAKNLKFEEDPNYSYLRSVLNKIIINNKFINERYHFSWINNVNLSSKNLIRRKTYLHQRVLQSLEIKRINDTKSENKILLNTINESNLPDSSLYSYSSKNTESKKKNFLFSHKLNQPYSALYNFRTLIPKPNINNSKGERKTIKNTIFENKLHYSKATILNNKKIYLKPDIYTINNCFINIKEINNNKIKSNTFLKEHLSIINKLKNKRSQHNYYSNNNSGISISNSKISKISNLPQNNALIPIKTQRSYVVKIKNNLSQHLNDKNKNNLPIKISKTQLYDNNCH